MPSPCAVAGSAYLIDRIASVGSAAVLGVLSDGGSIDYSDAGYTIWTNTTIPGMGSLLGAIYHSGTSKFLVCDANRVASSTDCLTWTVTALGTTLNAPRMYTNGSSIYILSLGSANYAYSTNGSSWVAGTLIGNTAGAMYDGLYGQGFVVGTWDGGTYRSYNSTTGSALNLLGSVVPSGLSSVPAGMMNGTLSNSGGAAFYPGICSTALHSSGVTMTIGWLQNNAGVFSVQSALTNGTYASGYGSPGYNFYRVQGTGIRNAFGWNAAGTRVGYSSNNSFWSNTNYNPNPGVGNNLQNSATGWQWISTSTGLWRATDPTQNAAWNSMRSGNYIAIAIK